MNSHDFECPLIDEDYHPPPLPLMKLDPNLAEELARANNCPVDLHKQYEQITMYCDHNRQKCKKTLSQSKRLQREEDILFDSNSLRKWERQRKSLARTKPFYFPPRKSDVDKEISCLEKWERQRKLLARTKPFYFPPRKSGVDKEISGLEKKIKKISLEK